MMKFFNLVLVFFTGMAVRAAAPIEANHYKASAKLEITVTGFHSVRIRSSASGLLYRQLISKNEVRYGLSNRDVNAALGSINGRPVNDTLPVSLSEGRWRYTLKNGRGEIIAVAETDPDEWPEQLLPQLHLPGHPVWNELYRKAWQLNWHHTVTSAALPTRYAYNATADDSLCYAWDACFNVLFQRYAAPSGTDPVMCSLDNFYARETPEGFISRRYKTATFRQIDLPYNQPAVKAVNPPLFAWAEWEYYQITADLGRLKKVLPGLISQYEFIDRFLQEKSGRYVWGGNPSGWDNILEVQNHKYWVELPAMQALSAQCIAKMAAALNEKEIAGRFLQEVEKKRQVMPNYWDNARGWFCSQGDNGQFTGKTLSGMWPVLANMASADQMHRIVQNLMDTSAFLTAPMPLPSLAKNEQGYDPRGRYWHGSVWINMSLLTIRSLENYGDYRQSRELAIRTLNGMAAVYQHWNANPKTLWECYAPELSAPASSKHSAEPGTVRGDFADWTCCLINLLIEDIMGIQADAPANAITWQLWDEDHYGIKNLRFAKTTTSLKKTGHRLVIETDKPYLLRLMINGQLKNHRLQAGRNIISI